MKIYTFSEEGFRQLRQQLIIRMLVAWLFLAGLFSVISYGKTIADQYKPVPDAAEPWIGIAVNVLVITIFAIYLCVQLVWETRKLRKIISSAKLVLDQDYISRSRCNIPTLTVDRSQVRMIEETHQGIVVHAQDKQTLLVPKQLELGDYHEIREILHGWSPIQQTGSKRLGQSLVPIALIEFGVLLLGKPNV